MDQGPHTAKLDNGACWSDLARLRECTWVPGIWSKQSTLRIICIEGTRHDQEPYWSLDGEESGQICQGESHAGSCVVAIEYYLAVNRNGGSPELWMHKTRAIPYFLAWPWKHIHNIKPNQWHNSVPRTPCHHFLPFLSYTLRLTKPEGYLYSGVAIGACIQIIRFVFIHDVIFFFLVVFWFFGPNIVNMSTLRLKYGQVQAIP